MYCKYLHELQILRKRGGGAMPGHSPHCNYNTTLQKHSVHRKCSDAVVWNQEAMYYSSYRDMKNIGTCYLQLEHGNISDKVKWGYLAQFWEKCMIVRAMESSIMINGFVSVKHNVIKLLTI